MDPGEKTYQEHREEALAQVGIEPPPWCALPEWERREWRLLEEERDG
jgi:hypothetical protein